MNIPEWANWLARDKDGKLWAYEKKPFALHREEEWISESGDYLLIEETDDRYAHIKWEDEEPTPVTDSDIYGNANMNGGPSDLVNHPPHYKGIEGLEVRTVQENFVPKYEKHGVMIACDIKDSIKYILRAPDKNGVEDLKKAVRMLNYAIERWEGEQ